MKFQPGNKQGRKFERGRSGNPAGRPPRWKRLARAIDAIDDPFIPRFAVLTSAGASPYDVIAYDAEPERSRKRMPYEVAVKLLDDHSNRSARAVEKALSFLERYTRKVTRKARRKA